MSIHQPCRTTLQHPQEVLNSARWRGQVRIEDWGFGGRGVGVAKGGGCQAASGKAESVKHNEVNAANFWHRRDLAQLKSKMWGRKTNRRTSPPPPQSIYPFQSSAEFAAGLVLGRKVRQLVSIKFLLLPLMLKVWDNNLSYKFIRNDKATTMISSFMQRNNNIFLEVNR